MEELYNIVSGHRLLRMHRQGVYCFWQLALWCLIDQYGGMANNNTIVEAHLLASLPYVEEMLAEEETYADLSGDQTEKLDDDLFSEEYVCSICKVCLWNMILKVVATSSSASKTKSTKRRRTTLVDENDDDDEPLSMLCGKCADETLKSKTITTECVFRFGPTAQLRQQFDRVRARFSE